MPLRVYSWMSPAVIIIKTKTNEMEHKVLNQLVVYYSVFYKHFQCFLGLCFNQAALYLFYMLTCYC